MKTLPKLTLVGAGPGDPDLISVKGIKAIADADVILYDDLATKELLTYAKAKTEKIYVGKRVGKHSHTQETINQLIVHFAQEKGHVVRLKGGDPFIFGRGYEEIEYVNSHNIETAIVPGISSAHAVPALQGIPLTSRGVSQSYWVVTATSKDGSLTNDISLAAQSTATVVILMGTRKLREICDTFSAHGQQESPVAIIQNGTMPDEKIIIGTVSSIYGQAQAEKISSPAVIIIGETVSLSHANWRKELNLNQYC
ncbi:uroporphyrinogen-III C-methyltransferase [Roseivirga sp. E12]|uniref:uroporphyrinogen-III C-methyltransferase n=1 Tax=Roseivirga sp. E12 TaxID=2819237 RepID=UPI001ABD3CB2|nr:uroporphyrinogen-III C-methyltransferase [Roseivirga sp. E12]MBO3700149.1 uroporphyrinogen-III C-methyltransferase [Roseivirga sp. E12]